MVKKFIASLMVVFAVVLFGGIATATAAQATTTSITSSVGVAKAVPKNVTTSVTSVTSVPKIIGGGVIRPAYVLNNCYNTMFGETWCYRSHCTYFDVVVLGCYWGWVKINRPWYT